MCLLFGCQFILISGNILALWRIYSETRPEGGTVQLNKDGKAGTAPRKHISNVSFMNSLNGLFPKHYSIQLTIYLKSIYGI